MTMIEMVDYQGGVRGRCEVSRVWYERRRGEVFFFQAEDGIRDAQESRGLGDVYKRQVQVEWRAGAPVACVEGDCAVGGVPGSGSGIELDFSQTAGKVTGRLFPTNTTQETLTLPSGERVRATLLDAGQPTVFVTAESVRLGGACAVEWAAELSGSGALTGVLEEIRGAGAVRMGMVDCWEDAAKESAYSPFLVIVSGSSRGDGVEAMCVFMQQVHKAFPVTGAVATAAGALVPGTLVHEKAGVCGESVMIRHPTGRMSVRAIVNAQKAELLKASVMRSARTLICLLYTSDAADEEDSVDLGGRRIIKKKKREISRQGRDVTIIRQI
eukprot:TRINITY_DN28434_c0_g1_i1.p1 TRINITY_DN28434_c0_g1~~TRINITY_DN28434_c0_g1_i1.p1  ORF type:complete len:327 (-),score=42.70 TRINITY_DN28434_c0_g1_i1:84-1064(-)